jgi:hypothetical protein
MAKSKIQQFGLVAVGIMVAIGFSGVFSYSGLVNTSDNQNPEEREFNATLPEDHFSEQSYGLSVSEQARLIRQQANENGTFIAFVNVVYDNESEVSDFSDLETLPEEMDNRVYINLIDSSEEAWGTQYQIEPPEAIVVGTQTRQGRIAVLPQRSETDRASIKETACGSMVQLGDLAATCF